MSTDRELLEMAAKAYGLPQPEEGGYWYSASNELSKEGWGIVTFYGRGKATFWNPITEDQDAAGLAEALGMRVEANERGCTAMLPTPKGLRVETVLHRLVRGDGCAAKRLAITRAAASLGRDVKGG